MPLSDFFTLLPGLLAFMVAGQADQVRGGAVQREVIVRIPVQSAPTSSPVQWAERKGPECIATETIRGAAISGREHVDFLLMGRRLVRAQLAENCPALDFYNGFYVTPDGGKICARRDSIHSRIGSSCRIERFRKLVPKGER